VALARETREVMGGEPRLVKGRGGKEIKELAGAFNHAIDELTRMRRRLAVIERIAARREVARQIAHEIKNPLAPIRAAVETLRRLRAREDPAFDEYFEEATATVRYSDNDFLYGTEDPQALRCPIGAHIRRANPRDTLAPGDKMQIDISNRHRIMRVGRLYRPWEGENPGLLFMCLNGDIERQFEFIQQTWLISPAFHGLAGEQDPLTSNCDGTGYVVPTHDGPVRLKPLPQFVKTLGGGYFFMPGRSFLRWLGGE